MTTYITEKVPCFSCGATGKLPRFVFWEKNCHVCDGTGERRIIMPADLPGDWKEMLRLDATYGANRLPF